MDHIEIRDKAGNALNELLFVRAALVASDDDANVMNWTGAADGAASILDHVATDFEELIAYVDKLHEQMAKREN